MTTLNWFAIITLAGQNEYVAQLRQRALDLGIVGFKLSFVMQIFE